MPFSCDPSFGDRERQGEFGFVEDAGPEGARSVGPWHREGVVGAWFIVGESLGRHRSSWKVLGPSDHELLVCLLHPLGGAWCWRVKGEIYGGWSLLFTLTRWLARLVPGAGTTFELMDTASLVYHGLDKSSPCEHRGRETLPDGRLRVVCLFRMTHRQRTEGLKGARMA